MKKALVVCHMGRHYRKFGHYDIKPLQELGYEVHFAANFTLDIDKVEDDSIVLHQVDFQRSPFSIKNIKAYKQIKKIIDENDFDIIHCQSPVGGVLTRLANQKLKHKCRILYTAHGFHFYKGAPITMWLLFYPIEKWLAKYTDVIITINKEDYNLAKKRFSKRCSNIYYIPGIGIDLSKFNILLKEKEIVDLRKSINIKEDDVVLIYVAELSKRKNQLWLIRNINELITKNNKIHLLLVGNDSYDKKCNKLVDKLKINSNVHILGQRNDVPKLLKISDISVSSSIQEGLPLNIMESLASGLPVVALKCRGMDDLIEKNANGYIVKNGKEFKESILYILNNNEIINTMKSDNIKKSNEYSVVIINKKIKEIIQKKS